MPRKYVYCDCCQICQRPFGILIKRSSRSPNHCITCEVKRTRLMERTRWRENHPPKVYIIHPHSKGPGPEDWPGEEPEPIRSEMHARALRYHQDILAGREIQYIPADDTLTTRAQRAFLRLLAG